MTRPAHLAGPGTGPTPGDAPSGESPTADLRRIVNAASAVLAQAGVDSPRHDALALAAHALGVDRVEPALPPPLPEGFTGAYAQLVERRRRREPLQHITGVAAFRHLTLEMGAGVFVPRPETESLAQVAIDEAARTAREQHRAPVVVDLCCGAGPIALAVATEVPGAQVWAVDVSEAAVRLTRRNAEAAGVSLEVIQGEVGSGDLLAGPLARLHGAVDVVAANPPYIPPDAVPTQPEVTQHDPDLALYGGGVDGLAIPSAVVQAAAALLRPAAGGGQGGLLVMEHADVQGEAARSAARAVGGWEEIATLPDLTGRDRMLVARRGA